MELVFLLEAKVQIGTLKNNFEHGFLILISKLNCFESWQVG
jgi:hypothetical protein